MDFARVTKAKSHCAGWRAQSVRAGALGSRVHPNSGSRAQDNSDLDKILLTNATRATDVLDEDSLTNVN
jgi:hypothetical protein